MASNSEVIKHGLGVESVVDDEKNTDQGEDFGVPLPLEKLNLRCPKKKLIILDLNGLLVYRTHRWVGKIPSNRKHDGLFGNQFVYKRPFCEEFMNFCLQRFEIGLWSSGKVHNVDGVLDCVFKGLRSKLLFVWNQDHCTDYGFKTLENKEKPLFFRELKKVWVKVMPPCKHGSYSASNTLLIDETPYKGLLNPPNTGIYPEAYDANNLADNALDPKEELGRYLNGLAEAEDVQAYVEAHPFGQPAVGPEHPDWEFYSNIRLTCQNMA
ncbi:hypothetical protein Dimus_007050 [Dionaea muscipula]